MDRITTASSDRYVPEYGWTDFDVMAGVNALHLSDGTTWDFFAGWAPGVESKLGEVVTDAKTVSYVFRAPSGGFTLPYIAYAPNGQSRATFALPDTLVLTADIGATSGKISGFAKVVDNFDYGGPGFARLSAPVGSNVYFENAITLLEPGSVFSENLFGGSFSYITRGTIDLTRLASPVPEPGAFVLLSIGAGVVGLARISRRRQSKATDPVAP